MKHTSQMIRIMSAVMAVLLMTAMLAGCGKTQTPGAQTGPTGETQGGQQSPAEPSDGASEPSTDDPTKAPTGIEETMEPTAPPVQLVMPEYELTYAGTMAELITWEELTEEGGLRFYVELGSGKLPIFTMLLDQAQGDNVTVKKNQEGEEIFITFLMEQVPEGLSEADNKTFCMAQDIVNDIADSLVLL